MVCAETELLASGPRPTEGAVRTIIGAATGMTFVVTVVEPPLAGVRVNQSQVKLRYPRLVLPLPLVDRSRQI